MTINTPVVTATPNSQYAYVNLLVSGLSGTRVNLVLNPSFEIDTTSWQVWSGGTTIARSSTWYHSGAGRYSVAATCVSAGTVGIQSSAATTNFIQVTPGETYSGFCYAYTATAGRTLQLGVVWLDATGATISSVVGASATSVANTEAYLSASWTAPANAAGVSFYARALSCAVNEVYYFDAFMFEHSPTVNSYFFDGYHPGCEWNGAVGNSTSTMLPPDTLTVSRQNPDGSIVPIRSCNKVGLSGNNDTWTGIDYEAPLGQSVTYQALAEVHSPNGTYLSATGTSNAATVPVSPGTAWLKNLSQSALSMTVTVSNLGDVKRPARQQAYPVIGRKNPVVISDVRGGRQGTLALLTTTMTDFNNLTQLLDSGQTLFFQATPDDNFPDMYLAAGDYNIKRPGVSTDLTRVFEVDYIEVDSPSGTLTTMPGNSYLLVMNYSSYQDVMNQRSTYLDVLNHAYGT